MSPRRTFAKCFARPNHALCLAHSRPPSNIKPNSIAVWPCTTRPNLAGHSSRRPSASREVEGRSRQARGGPRCRHRGLRGDQGGLARGRGEGHGPSVLARRGGGRRTSPPPGAGPSSPSGCFGCLARVVLGGSQGLLPPATQTAVEILRLALATHSAADVEMSDASGPPQEGLLPEAPPALVTAPPQEDLPPEAPPAPVSMALARVEATARLSHRSRRVSRRPRTRLRVRCRYSCPRRPVRPVAGPNRSRSARPRLRPFDSARSVSRLRRRPRRAADSTPQCRVNSGRLNRRIRRRLSALNGRAFARSFYLSMAAALLALHRLRWEPATRSSRPLCTGKLASTPARAAWSEYFRAAPLSCTLVTLARLVL